jgi:hypothetical protein
MERDQRARVGALAWRDATFMVNYNDMKAFADAHPCETKY